ncbi:MAG TPA: hypothetical protein VLB76_12530 [Thermoanaerobaculia bacterium]|nr:hypothetical protein [Thermoanaerobaculia bacterium]
MGTAITVLVAFAWMTAGGNAWAEVRSLQRNPAQVLRELADNPRLALSAQEKEYLRQAAQRLDQPRPEAVHVLASHAAPDPAVEMKEMAAELGQLASQDGTAPESAEKRRGGLQSMAGLEQRLVATDKRVLRDFAATEALLRAAHLPQIIFERHQAAQDGYVKKMRSVLRSLEGAEKSQSPGEYRSAIAAAAALLGKSTDEPTF